MQLTNLVNSPIARKTNLDYHIVETKFRKSKNGLVNGYGIIELPK